MPDKTVSVEEVAVALIRENSRRGGELSWNGRMFILAELGLSTEDAEALDDLAQKLVIFGKAKYEPPWTALDPGIRETVRALWRDSFETVDSGDGRSKLARGIPAESIPHVYIKIRTGYLETEGRRLWDWCYARRGWVEPSPDENQPWFKVEAHYVDGGWMLKVLGTALYQEG